MQKRSELRLVLKLAIITGLSLIGQFAVDLRSFWGVSAWGSSSIIEFLLRALFWVAFFMLLYCVYEFSKLRSKNELIGLSSLGMVVAITSLGQFALKGLSFFRSSLLPLPIIHVLLGLIFLLAVYYVVKAVSVWREL